MSKRDAIRAALLGNSKRRSMLVQVAGEEVELRAPSLALRDRILEAGKPVNGAPTKLAAMVVEMLLACAYDPESGRPAFEEADRDVLMECDPAPLDELAAKVSELMNVKQGEVAKN